MLSDCARPARLGLIIAVFTRGQAAVLVGVRGKLESAPVGVFHDAAGGYKAFGLSGVGRGGAGGVAVHIYGRTNRKVRQA